MSIFVIFYFKKVVINEMKNTLEVGNRIRNVREGLRMSRSVFSEKINISESYLAQLELGNKSIGINTLIALCEYTGYSSDYFLFGNNVNDDLNKKIIRMVSVLPENSLDLVYEVVRSIKSHNKIK